MKRLLSWLIAGTRGGITRGRIIQYIRENPCNANKLAESLKIDYKTVRHHIDVLLKHRIIVNIGEGYGRQFHLSEYMKANINEFDAIWQRFGKK